MTTVAPATSTRPAIAAILAISAAATVFLFWLIYVHPATDASSARFAFLPALNALLNGLSATALLIGYIFIRARRIAAHRAAMITAFGFSTLFLVSYILHHALHGDVRYPVHAALRSVYLPLLAIAALPLILATFFFSLSGRIPQHRKVARWTFPLWLYVSVTGVVTYVMLRLAQG
jgi:putative membrane protein